MDMKDLAKAPVGLFSAARYALLGFAISTLLGACDQQSDTGNSNDNPFAKSELPSEPTVVLSPNQMAAIKTGTAGLSVFHHEKEAVGIVSFPREPGIVQGVATLLSASASYKAAQKELQRANSLLASKGVSEREVEQATADDQTAKATLESARSGLLQLGKSNAEIDKIIATRTLEPYAGTRLGIKWVLASAPEADAAAFRTGQRLLVTTDAESGSELSGAVTEVYAAVDPSLHRITVRGRVGDPTDMLRPGMLVRVKVEVAKSEISTAIANNGVVREGDGTMTAWVATSGKTFVQKQIKIGMLEGGKVQILDGVKPGQRVVTDGAILLDNVLLAPSGD